MSTRRNAIVLTAGCLTLATTSANATPSANVWAPSTHGVQGFGLLHVTYDTYFGADGLYPIDVGLTMGVLPWKELQLELGFDLFYPTADGTGAGLSLPILFNAKLATPEDALFPNQPGISFGVYSLGLEDDVTDYNILYGMVGKTLPYVGAVSVGGYYGLNEALMTSSAGEVERAGLIAGWFSQPIDVPLIDRVHLSADVQTGENGFGAAGGALYFYFTPTVNLVTGPVFFFDPDKQPGGESWMWTAQVDVDVDLK
jgi:hypothetical protein